MINLPTGVRATLEVYITNGCDEMCVSLCALKSVPNLDEFQPDLPRLLEAVGAPMEQFSDGTWRLMTDAEIVDYRRQESEDEA